MKKQITKELLDIGAVQINLDTYFTWTSGLKSPIYCDNRLTMSYPKVRKKIAQAFIHMLEEESIKPDVIAGCATAGIPHAAWLSDLLNLPMVYVRSKPKVHGKGNQIEGASVEGKTVLVIEDLISTGGSSIEAAKALQQAGANILAVYSIFTYGLNKSKEAFSQANIAYKSITGFDDLIQELISSGELSEEEKIELLTFRDSL
ncbi:MULTISPECIES: orotate phosphoribosyltransferase [Oceanobacillus]|uniref:orotate phosphoribosyltransferase n=1 Tax=Oceanobacillus TaxID=182709 RepID=UPI000986619A|nr:MULTISPECIES: orotate phosphoribosyltransferase [Oceanobacillus]MBT2598772.1 orotate phosphoribosyltransferase [Oceanobacillus sp. ISL-74]MBT2651691.1 orotate phosphoribosyltransferase [Oceanobacillus sp. ISL-73]